MTALIMNGLVAAGLLWCASNEGDDRMRKYFIGGAAINAAIAGIGAVIEIALAVVS